jgi:hypothetical protein
MVEYFSFEEVMRELELSEEDLKRMVSEGELRAFRSENKMKFKREDVEHLKKGRITEPTIILPSTPGATQDDTVLDLDVTQESQNLEVSQSRGRPPSHDDLLVPAEEARGGGAEAPGDEDAGLTTEPLKLADEVETAETVEGEAEEAPARGRRSTLQRSRRATSGSALATEEEIERRRAGPVWTALTILAFVFAAWSALFGWDQIRMERGAQQPSALTSGVAQFVMDWYWKDADWVKIHKNKFPDGKEPPFPQPEKYQGSPYEIKHRKYNAPSFREADAPAKPAAPSQ